MYRLYVKRDFRPRPGFVIGTLQELQRLAALPGVTVLPDPYNPPGFPGATYGERDLAHEADLRRQAREQLRLDCMDE